MFAYYARWIENFSRTAGPLLRTQHFPLSEDALKSFEDVKSGLAKVSLDAIRDNVPFEVESDASDYAIAGILSQNGRPVAFMSRTLNACKRKYPAIEKEATAIIEAVRKWSHFLKGRPFLLRTDQKSVSYMFDQKNRGKIKNYKIRIWRLEMSQFTYDICHKPSVENIAPDAFSPVCSSLHSVAELRFLHDSLGHPGFSKFCCDRKSRAAYAQCFAMWQQATIEFTSQDHSSRTLLLLSIVDIVCITRDYTLRSLYYCLFAPHVCMVLFFTHIPFMMNHTINATPPERLQHYYSPV